VANHPTPWIKDPLKKVFYTAHGYWGPYDRTYDEANALWQQKGY
jgi:hypothetical protein